jgi:hypothetical protein
VARGVGLEFKPQHHKKKKERKKERKTSSIKVADVYGKNKFSICGIVKKKEINVSLVVIPQKLWPLSR